jgi:hypothetical protein
LIDVHGQFHVAGPLRRERRFDVLTESTIIDPPFSRFGCCYEIHRGDAAKAYKRANRAGVLLNEFRNTIGNLICEICGAIGILELLVDIVPKPRPDLLEGNTNLRVYRSPVYRGPQIEVWKALLTIPAVTGHT